MILAVIIPCAVLVASVGIGQRTIAVLGISPRDPEAAFYCAASGLGVLTFVMFAAGLTGLLTPPFAWILLCVLLLVFGRAGLAALGGLRSLVRRFLRPSGWLAAFLLAVVLSIAAIDFVCALAPPTETDALTMHLLAPREYIAAGRMLWLPDALDSPMVMGPHLIYTFVLLVSGRLWIDAAPAVLHFLLGLILMLWTWHFVARRFGKTCAYAAAAVFWTMPMITQLAIAPMVDMFLGLYSMAALVSLVRYVRRRGFAWLASAAVFAALACGAKYSGFVTLAAVFVTALVTAAFGSNRLASARRLAVAAVLALVIVAPFPLRNWSWTGNPIAPTLKSVFGGPGWDEAPFQQSGADDARYESLHHSVRNMLFAPWLLTMHAELASSGPSGVITYAFLLFLPLSVFLRSRRGFFPSLAVYCIVTFALAYWTTARPRSRYFLSIMPVASAYVAAGLVLLRRYSRPAWRIAQLALVASVLFGAAVTCVYAVSFVKVVFGVTPRDAFLAASTDCYGEYKWMADTLGPGAKVLVGATNDLYYLKTPAMRLDSSHKDGLAVFGLDDAGSPEKALGRMRAFGITHLFVKENMVDPAGSAQFARILASLAGDGRLVLVRSSLGTKGTRNPLAKPRDFKVALYRVEY